MKKIKQVLDNKIFHFIFKIIEFLFFACIILYLVFIMLQRFSNNSSIAGFRMFTVATKSMTPIYNVGDVLLVKEQSLSNLKVGDDITYLGEKDDFKDKIVTHRIIEINDDEIITQGVASSLADPKINYDQVFGKVIHKVYSISFISKVIRNQYGFYFLVFAPLVIIVFLEVVEIISEGKKDEN